jgi:hypothetical protein
MKDPSYPPKETGKMITTNASKGLPPNLAKEEVVDGWTGKGLRRLLSTITQTPPSNVFRRINPIRTISISDSVSIICFQE